MTEEICEILRLPSLEWMAVRRKKFTELVYELNRVRIENYFLKEELNARNKIETDEEILGREPRDQGVCFGESEDGEQRTEIIQDGEEGVTESKVGE